MFSEQTFEIFKFALVFEVTKWRAFVLIFGLNFLNENSI